MIKTDNALIFDLDGTLLNTDELIFRSFRYTFQKFLPDHTLTQEELLSFLGPSLKDSFSRYLPQEEVEKAIDVYREFNYAKHNEFVTLYPNEIEVLEKLHNQGFKMAVVTTKYTDTAIYGLKSFGLDHYFEKVIGSEEVSHAKPHPEGVNKALESLHKSQGFMIGDNVTDLLAGKNAGIKCIGVSWSLKGTKDLIETHPDYMMDSYQDLFNYLERI